ncbi:MAG: NADPH-dependent FMN reductase [Marinobacter sp.]
MKFLIFLGSTRDSTPPKPARLGLRVAKALEQHFAETFPDHDVEIIDPLDWTFDPVFKPHFAYPQSKVPEQLDELAKKIQAADGYVMVSPEYNHSMSPALAHMLNHFGSSLFAYKPSLIVTYSAGQWGGARAAVTMRGFLSELGCLPVSAMIQIPEAADALTETGAFRSGQDEASWQSYFRRGSAQLLWWAEATFRHREQSDPHAFIGNFRKDPKQRNAPG